MNTENNKIIAEFMEYIKHTQTKAYLTTDGYFHEKDLKFNSDWNWLMEVVQKIKTVGYLVYFDLQFIGCEISVIDIDGSVIFSTYPKKNTQEKQLIDCVYISVLNFIEWYNSQQS